MASSCPLLITFLQNRKPITSVLFTLSCTTIAYGHDHWNQISKPKSVDLMVVPTPQTNPLKFESELEPVLRERVLIVPHKDVVFAELSSEPIETWLVLPRNGWILTSITLPPTLRPPYPCSVHH